MRSSQDKPLQEVIKQLINHYNLNNKLMQVQIASAWDTLMGAAVSKQTNDIYFANGKLYIKIESSVLKNELNFGKDKIIALLNRHTASQSIKELILI